MSTLQVLPHSYLRQISISTRAKDIKTKYSRVHFSSKSNAGVLFLGCRAQNWQKMNAGIYQYCLLVVVTVTEDGCADTDHSATHLGCNVVITGHSEREFREVVQEWIASLFYFVH